MKETERQHLQDTPSIPALLHSGWNNGLDPTSEAQIPLVVSSHKRRYAAEDRAWHRRYRGLGLILLLNMLVVLPAYAQYRFDSWTTDNGLPQNSILAILKARDGYMWMVNGNGLIRFDGLRFTIFDRITTPSLPGNGAVGLFEDRNGTIWFAASQLIRYQRGEFKAFTLPGESIRAVTGDGSGRLWVLAGKAVWEFSHERFIKQVEPASAFRFHQYQFDRPLGFWWDGDPLRWYSGGTMASWSRASLGLAETDDIHSMVMDAKGTLWVAVYNRGIFKVVDGRLVSKYDTSNGLPNLRVGQIFQSGVSGCEGEQADLWFAGEGWLLRMRNGVLTRQQLPNTDEPINIRTLLEDCEGNLWLGTNRHGLIRARLQLINTYSLAEGLASSNVYPLIEDNKGQIWAGSWPDGLSHFEAGRFISHRLSLSAFPRALALDPRGRIAMAVGRGFLIQENGQLVFREFDGLKDSQAPDLRFEPVVLHWDRSGALWLGADHLGIFRRTGGETLRWKPADHPLFDAPKTILEARDGSIWIGGYGGLAHFQDGKMSYFTAGNGLPGNTVRSLYEDGQGGLWVGTYDSGLGRYANGHWTTFTVREGLYDNGIFAIIEDAQGFFWMSCNRGIQRVSRQELSEVAEGRIRTVTALAFGKEDGMRNAECNGGAAPSGVRARDGKLWFPTQDGIAVIDPSKVAATRLKAPPVQIEECLVDGVTRLMDAPVRVEPGHASIEIHYTALSFANSDKLPFRYRLRGLNDDWIVAGTRRSVTYSYLPPGDYRFEVIAANRDGVWNETGASIRIQVIPPFWRRPWFISLAGCVLFGVAFAAYFFRVGQLKRAHAAQEDFSRQLINSQEGERKRIATELHDSLGQRLVLIKNLALLLLHQGSPTHTLQTQVQEISEETSRALKEVKEISYNLRPHELEQVGLTKTLQGLVRQLGEASGIAMVAELDPLDDLFPSSDQINVFRIVQEGLNNIVKHSGASNALLTILVRDEHAELSIEDNGAGLKQSRTAGLGLKSIAERVRLMDGTFTIETAEISGTVMRIKLRCRKELKDGNTNPNS